MLKVNHAIAFCLALQVHFSLAQNEKWTTEDSLKLSSDCIQTAQTFFIPGAAADYCSCYLDLFFQNHPGPGSSVSDSMLVQYSETCIVEVKHRYPGGPFIESWNEDSKASFIAGCKRTLNGSSVNAELYCPCMLEKLMKFQPDPRLVNMVEQSVLDKFASECLSTSSGK